MDVCRKSRKLLSKQNVMKFILLLLVFIVQTNLFAQRIDTTLMANTNKAAYERYMKKRATYKTVGLTMVGAGVLAGIISVSWWLRRDLNGTWDLEPLFIAGIVTTGASIPVFIIAGQYKRKARLALAGETSRLPGTLAPVRYPALALQLSF
jgi:hypothetical protein